MFSKITEFIDYDIEDVNNFVDSVNKDNVMELVIDRENQIIAYKSNDYELHTLQCVNINILEDVLKRITPLTKNVYYRNLENEIDLKRCPIDKIKLFQKVTGLADKEFDYKVEVINVLEELFETSGYESKEARERAEEIFNGYFKDKQIASEKDLLDAFLDIIVFSMGAIMKLGYDPKLALNEVAKIVNSRRGEIVNGKFIKHKDEESKKLWYEPKFDKCKL